MKLSARMLQNVQSVNVFEAVDALRRTEGDSEALYFVLIDASQDRPTGRRYVAPDDSELEVTLHNIDDARELTRSATQPFPGDLSIWKVTLLTTDSLRGTITMGLTLTVPDGPGTRDIQGSLKCALRVDVGV